MATEELNRPPSLPPYTEMIFAAIDSLKGKKDSSLSSISNYIESSCGDLPDEHSDILMDHLKKLVDNGELVVVNYNYMRPNHNVSAKRGRGRPSKPKNAAVLESPVQTPAQLETEGKRGRGRPKKDPNAPPSAKKAKVSLVATPPSKTGRPRGRPRKVQPEPPGVEAAN